MDFIITTTNHIEGYDIEKYCGIIAVRKEYVDMYFDSYFERAKEDFIDKAKGLGANAVVGFRVDIVSTNLSHLYLTGTAIKIYNDDELPEL